MRESISIVIPVYNSSESLPELTQRILAVFATNGLTGEIIFVNDCSRDRSWECIGDLSARHPEIRAINLMRNYGQHNALLCGIRAARHPLIVTMDDDLQHPPEEIPALLERLNEGYDVVYGTPQHQQHGLLRDIASQITKIALQTAMGSNIARQTSAFRVFRSAVRHAFGDYHGTFVSVDVLLTWGTTRFASLPVQHDARRHGTSNYTFGKLLHHALNMMTGFSTAPLQAASLMGFGSTLVGLAILVFVVMHYLIWGSTVPGFTFLASVIAIFSGTQMLALGIIGEYLARVHFRTMNRPPYAVREEIGAACEEPAATAKRC